VGLEGAIFSNQKKNPVVCIEDKAICHFKSLICLLGTSTPQSTNEAKNSSVRRFDYLLKQTELFSHFMGNTKATSPLKIKDKKTKKSTAGGKEGDHRHRMTEQEEDEELLSDLNQAKKVTVSFDESPPYIKVGHNEQKIFFLGTYRWRRFDTSLVLYISTDQKTNN
jgi:hypothetical protein